VRQSLLSCSSLGLALCLANCGDAASDVATGPRSYRGFHSFTLELGQSANSESIKLVPGRDLAVLSSSKAKRATLVRLDGDALVELRARSLFPSDTSESELTSVEVAPSGEWAVFTRTLETRDPTSGEQTSCGGELVFVDISDSAAFGTILKELPVGPMPDSVDVSSDGRLVAVANERDSAWGGKCKVAGVVPSVSIVDVSAGVAQASELYRVTMLEDEVVNREPETVAFSRDNDLVVCTLQDSYEVALFRVSALVGLSAPTSRDVNVVRLPKNELGKDPWPDGVAAFTDKTGAEYFAIAGEWNDTLMVIDAAGKLVANVDIRASDMPSDLPRDTSGEPPPFRPDSLAMFRFGGEAHLAVSLKHAGAVGIWDVGDATAPRFTAVVKVGKADSGTPSTPSSIGTEGIAATPTGDSIVCANEGEGSVSLVRVSP